MYVHCTLYTYNVVIVYYIKIPQQQLLLIQVEAFAV